METSSFLQTSNVLLFVVAVVSVLVFFKSRKRAGGFGRLPPGPPPLPILGNILQIDLKQPYKTYLDLAKRYGPVYTLWLGRKPVVVLSGLQTLRDAFITQGEEFSGRAAYPILLRISKGYGVLVSSGHRWRELRRFSITTLKNFGMGRRTLEDGIREEAMCLVKALEDYKGAVFQPSESMSKAVSNIICTIVFGHRFEYDHPDFIMLYTTVFTYFSVLSSPVGMFYNIFPSIVKRLPGKHQDMLAQMQKVSEYLQTQSDLRVGRVNADSIPQDYIEAFLIKMIQEKDLPNSEFHRENLLSSVWNMFSAGTETTTSTLRQMLLMMVKYPQIQARVQSEIDEVIGQTRSPSMSDRSKMPYTDAVIHEVQRSMDLTPIAVPHKVTVDTQFKNYYIPKDTTVFPLISSVLSDRKLWKNTDSFHPENFLDERGQFQKSDAFVAFGIGKRICLGEALARMELFLFFTTLLQRFTFVGTQPPEEIETSPQCSSFGKLPRIYSCHAKPRT